LNSREVRRRLVVGEFVGLLLGGQRGCFGVGGSREGGAGPVVIFRNYYGMLYILKMRVFKKILCECINS